MPKPRGGSVALQKWPERELASDPVALRFFKQLCKCCERGALQVVLARIVTPALRRRDSWAEAAGGISLKEMARLANKARQFTKSLQRVRETVLVKHLVSREQIPRGDLLHPSTRLKSLESIARLDDLAHGSGLGPLNRPDFDEDIEHLVKLVKMGCGRYHYDKLEQILAALGHPVRLKQYRSDRRRKEVAGGKTDDA